MRRRVRRKNEKMKALALAGAPFDNWPATSIFAEAQNLTHMKSFRQIAARLTISPYVIKPLKGFSSFSFRRSSGMERRRSYYSLNCRLSTSMAGTAFIHSEELVPLANESAYYAGKKLPTFRVVKKEFFRYKQGVT